MDPVEELFDNQNDPLELTNLGGSPDSAAVLEAMRKRYDQELTKWNTQAVNYNDYQRYGTHFDRSIPLGEKKALMGKERKSDSNRKEKLKDDRKQRNQGEERQ